MIENMMDTTTLPEVVLVEDSLDDEQLSLRGIVNSGIPCKVTVQRDGAAALDDLLGAKGRLPALIVLDYQLPKYNGLEVLKRLRSSEGASIVPVVIFSGSEAGKELSDCYRVGANSCVKKPDDPQEYVDRLGLVTRYWLTVNHGAVAT